MGAVLRTIPAAVAMLVLAAHFLRAQNVVLVAACLLLLPFLFIDLPAVRLLSRVFLAGGALVWVLTAWRIASFRMASGQPYVRMLVILGSVAAFTLLAAWLLPRAGKADDGAVSPRA